MNSGKSPATRKRLVFISSTARAQRLPAFDCSRVSARDADCGSTTCVATDMWFFSFCGFVAGMADVARATLALPQSSRCGSAWECRRTSSGLGPLWVKGFVGKTRSTLDAQRHQQMLIAEGVKEGDLGDRFRKELHRDRIGFNAFHILG